MEEQKDTQGVDLSNQIFPMPPQYHDDRNDINIIKEIKPDDVLKRIELKLKGFEYDDENRKWAKVREALMNEKGINKYMTILSAVSELVTLSRFKEEQIPPIVVHICDQAIPTIHVNYKDYGIKCKSDLGIIDIQLFCFTLSAFNKAIGGGDRSLIRGTYKEEGRMVNTLGQPQRNPLNSINPFRHG